MSFLTIPRRRSFSIIVCFVLLLTIGSVATHRQVWAAGIQPHFFVNLTQFAQRVQQNFSGWLRDKNLNNAAIAVAPPVFASFTVTNTNDSGAGSLRQAITDANAAAGTDTIEFALGAGTPLIIPLTALPIITDPVIINGNTGGSTRVELRGTSVGGSVSGLIITAGSSTISGLVINSFGAFGIRLETNGGNTVKGCYIGTNAAATTAVGNGFYGVLISASPNNTIGGTAASERNIISGNGGGGISITTAVATGNKVIGNFIGTDVTGGFDFGNLADGVNINAAPNNTIGGTAAGEGNIISGNDGDGVEINGSTATGNKISGNYIGTNAVGTIALGNSGRGVVIFDASTNTIGGTSAGERNVISGNGTIGVAILGASNKVIGNYIGIDVTGAFDLGNTTYGVLVSTANNTIGGTTAGERNVISGNNNSGVYILNTAATGNKIIGNYIGTSANGTADLGNSSYGVYINAAPNNTIGGMTAGERNVISGNDNSGVYIVNTAATGNKIIGNYLGTNAAGTADLGNATYGVYIDSASNNAIGGTTAGERNVISGNDNSGVYILNTAATGNKISGNYIGTDANGTADLGNTSAGVVINSASNNTIGGTTPSERNIISGNNDVGVFLFSSPTIGNKVIGNYIGTDVTGTLSLGNYVGVSISSAANNFIGGEIPSEGNIISGNNIGVVVSSSNGIGNKILRNSIFNNSNLGIDLGAVGVTANDALDPDIGANNLQNFPVLSCAISTNSSTIIQGTLNSLANTQFRIEFFINDACDASGNGEGQTFFFYANVMTNASGDATINAGITQAIAAGKFITATATRLDASGNPIETSEFSACKAVIAPTLSINDVTVAEGNSGTTNAIFTVTLTGAQGSCLPVTMNYAATGTGGDFNSTGGTLTFNTPISSSAVTQTITVPINGDVTVEANETFPVTLSSVSGATITKATGVGTITNDDSAVVTITDVSVTEGNSGFTSANFQISLSAPVDQLVSVNISAADGTATTANNDYLAPPVTILTFSPGSDHAASGISGRRHEC